MSTTVRVLFRYLVRVGGVGGTERSERIPVEVLHAVVQGHAFLEVAT